MTEGFRRVIFGLGSNLGERWRQLGDATGSLLGAGRGGTISSVYETAPVGGPGGQGAFLNCVVALFSDRPPHELLELAQLLETRAKRFRTVRWGPRTLDVDVLWIDGYRSDDEVLTVPHPRMFERAFVLAPLCEVASDLVPSGWEERFGGASAVHEQVVRVGALLTGV